MRCYQFFQTKSCELRKNFLAGLVTGLIASAQLPLYADIAMIAYLTLFSIGWVRSSGSASHAKKYKIDSCSKQHTDWMHLEKCYSYCISSSDSQRSSTSEMFSGVQWSQGIYFRLHSKALLINVLKTSNPLDPTTTSVSHSLINPRTT